jgi:hypothetical protein
MRSLLLGLALIALTVSSHAQAPTATDSLEAQAYRMVNGLLTGDYNTFIHYVHPKVIQISGGAGALRQALQQMTRQFSMAGLNFESVKIDSASAIINAGPTYQATIRQHTTMKTQQGRMVATTTLIGISSDNGLHWRFVDTNNKTMDQVRQLLPNVSEKLTIPSQQPPVRYDQ